MFQTKKSNWHVDFAGRNTVFDYEVANDKCHSDKDGQKPSQSGPHVVPQRDDEKGRQEVKLHVICQVPSDSHALKLHSFFNILLIKINECNEEVTISSCLKKLLT